MGGDCARPSLSAFYFSLSTFHFSLSTFHYRAAHSRSLRQYLAPRATPLLCTDGRQPGLDGLVVPGAGTAVAARPARRARRLAGATAATAGRGTRSAASASATACGRRRAAAPHPALLWLP